MRLREGKPQLTVTSENKYKPLVLRELRKLWDKYDPRLPWENGEYINTMSQTPCCWMILLIKPCIIFHTQQSSLIHTGFRIQKIIH
uniref:Uncharacterized protein n=1 Tax=Nelumbo nucifera TaxID=4432 RepID=A0A822ZSB5_NELNU|nr:TPA_asm: hypothetical protein HUJ06_016388 [Nelumbo nucifera]